MWFLIALNTPTETLKSLWFFLHLYKYKSFIVKTCYLNMKFYQQLNLHEATNRW